MHVRARDDSEVFYKHLKKKFKFWLDAPEERLERSENSFCPLMRSFDGKEGFYMNSKALN